MTTPRWLRDREAKQARDLAVFRRDQFKCRYCGFDGSDFAGWKFLVVDHFVPKSQGGSDEIDNFVTACLICNSMKSATRFASFADAYKMLATYEAQMRDYWNTNVKPLVGKAL